MPHDDKKRYGAEQVFNVACDMMKVNHKTVRGTKDTPRLHLVRQAIVAALRKVGPADFSYPDIAYMLGYKGHSRAHYQMRRFESGWPVYLQECWISGVRMELQIQGS